MIEDRKSLTDLLVLHGLSSKECADVADLLEYECPWFGEAESVSEAIGIDMLTDVLPQKIASLVGASRLVDWHNGQVRERTRLFNEAADVSYVSLVQTVSRFGVEDGQGRGDFWVMDESFSSPDAILAVSKPLPLPWGMLSALIEWLNAQSVIRTLTLMNDEGDELHKIVHKPQVI